MKVYGLHFAGVGEFREAVSDELKKVQKEEFSSAFQKMYDRAKACIYATGAYFEYKKVVSSLCVFYFKKSVVKRLDRCVYIS
jgi:hypothetical protein